MTTKATKATTAIDEDMFDDEDEDTMSDIYLTFALDNRDYGLAVKYVIEIVGLTPVTEVPDMPEFVKGIINLRGKVIPVMDMRIRFHMEETEYHERTCIVIISYKDRLAGLIVDAVREVHRIPPQMMEPAPRMGNAVASRYIQSIGKVGDEVKQILDVDSLLSAVELDQIEHAEVAEEMSSVSV